MRFYNVLEKRHSIREYESKKVPMSKIRKIIRAATMAPSGANGQPWRFYIVQDAKKRESIIQIVQDYYNLHCDSINWPKLQKILDNFYYNLGDAPCFIFIYSKKIMDIPEPVLDASTILAGANLINAAVVEGLGTCWINFFVHQPKKINKLLGVPKDEKLVVPLIVGYPRKGYKPLKRTKKKLNEVVKFF